MKILAWEKEVHAEGGYRKYYEGGKRGTTLQGGGTAGGLGIDYEFFESSLVPSIVVYGLLGLEARPSGILSIIPRLPASCPRIAVRGLLYHGVRMDVAVSGKQIEITVKDAAQDPLRVALQESWTGQDLERVDGTFLLSQPATYQFGRD